jgi:hypothetical protein
MVYRLWLPLVSIDYLDLGFSDYRDTGIASIETGLENKPQIVATEFGANRISLALGNPVGQ